MSPNEKIALAYMNRPGLGARYALKKENTMTSVVKKTTEETAETKKAVYEFDLRNSKSSHEYIAIRCHQAQVTLEDDGEQLINIGLSVYAKVRVTVSIEVDNAPDDGT